MSDFKKVKNKEDDFKQDSTDKIAKTNKEISNKDGLITPQVKEEKPQPYLIRLSTLLGSQLSMYGILAL
jgi:hypothetical protein